MSNPFDHLSDGDAFVTYYREQILQNRRDWIDFLLKPSRKKATGKLDRGDGKRCCLGHGCFALNIKRTSNGHEGWVYGNNEEAAMAPQEFIDKVGLWDDSGKLRNDEAFFAKKGEASEVVTLASLNDDTSWGPNRIGKYLLSVIEGGDDTPFRPLSGYPEQPKA